MDAEAAALEQEGNPDHSEMLQGFRTFIAEKKKKALEVLGLN